MIINQDESLVVPEKTIAFFPIIPEEGLTPFDMDISSFLKPLNTSHKREWFTPHFYNCLPLSIGNMQGFAFSVPYSFDIFWNGGNSVDDLVIQLHHSEHLTKILNTNHVTLSSEFGSGILTIHFPVQLKTPPGVNLMTIAPPNFPVPAMSPMTGVVECDNLRFTFTLNIKIDIPNTTIRVMKDAPLVGLIPIPRYFCDSFELKNANEIFEENIINQEMEIAQKHAERRENDNKNHLGSDRLYYRGLDYYENKFKDHQLPKKSNQ